VRTSVHVQFIGELTIEQVLHYFFFFSALSQLFNSVNQHDEKFVYIFLDSRVNGSSINIFECLAELFRVVVLLFQLH
jgi:hypothetical protein